MPFPQTQKKTEGSPVVKGEPEPRYEVIELQIKIDQVSYQPMLCFLELSQLIVVYLLNY